MAEGVDTALARRQMQLEKQKALLDQKRKNRQFQSGMVTANQIGTRPTTSKHLRPSSRPLEPIERKDNVHEEVIEDSKTSEETRISSPVEDGNTKESNQSILPDYSDDVKMKSDVNNEDIEEVPVRDMTQKLLDMGLSPSIGYDSDSSQEDIDFEPDSLLTDTSPAHGTAMILPSELTTHSVTTNSELKTSQDEKNPLGLIVIDKLIQNIPDAVLKPPPDGATIKCRITRDKQGIDKSFFPTYYLHLEWNGETKLFLLAARKRKRSRSSNYVISFDPTDLSRGGDTFIAKLRSNFVGTSFITYGSGSRPHSSNNRRSNKQREEFVAVQYEANVLGFKGPRRMNVIIPAMTPERERIKVIPTNNSEALLERFRVKDLKNLLNLYNKQPVWSEDTQAYVLNFHGRVTQASVKNFQLVHSADEDYVIMQFGRISDDVFTMDYSFPMCALQAFAIALSSFDSKLACE